jgi:hypothetical protein
MAKKTTGLTKMDAVRQALKDLGKDAKPTQLKGHIREKFGIEMSTDHISTSKGIILRKGKKPRAKKLAVQKETAKPPAGRNGISLQDIRSVKDLVKKVGADQLRGLIDLLAP